MSAEQLSFVRLTMRRMGESAASALLPSGTGLLKSTSGTLSIATPGTDYVYPAGVAGGQTINGGTAASENLTLKSTAHATKGYVAVEQNLYVSGTAGTAPYAHVGLAAPGATGSSITISADAASFGGITYNVNNSSWGQAWQTQGTTRMFLQSGGSGGNLVIGAQSGLVNGVGKLQVLQGGALESTTSGAVAISAYGGGSFTVLVGRDSVSDEEVALQTSGGSSGPILIVQSSHNLRLGAGGAETARLTTNQNQLLGLTTDVASSRLRVQASKTVASAGGAVWNGIDFTASTLTLTGTTTVSRLAFANYDAPTITDASVVTVTDAATLYVAGVPAAAGSVTITNSWAIYVAAGTSFFPTVQTNTVQSSAAISVIAATNQYTTLYSGAANVAAIGSGASGAGVFLNAGFYRPFRDTPASASTLTVSGNWAEVSGTTTINYISTTNMAIGTTILLRFAASLTVTHNAGSVPGGTASILFNTGANFSATSRDLLWLVYDGTNWLECVRSVIA